MYKRQVDEYLSLGKRQCLIHILSDLEIDASWLRDRDCYFDDSWTKKEYLGRALHHNQNYANQIQSWMDNIRIKVSKQGGSYFSASDTISIASYLAFLENFVDDFTEG